MGHLDRLKKKLYWMSEIDEILWDTCKKTMRDLPGVPYDDWFDVGHPAWWAADRAMLEAVREGVLSQDDLLSMSGDGEE